MISDISSFDYYFEILYNKYIDEYFNNEEISIMDINSAHNAIKHLFVIGNGFDCYLHMLPTRYADFRDYVLSLYPDAINYDGFIPSLYTLPDGSDQFNMEEVAGFIVKIIDDCEGDKWSDLETALGDSIFDQIDYYLDDIDWDGPDKEIRHAIYNNEDNSTNIRYAFVLIKELFCGWVDNILADLDFSKRRKEFVHDVIKDGDGFLNFNYSMTLEELYKIPSDSVCHIHGRVGDTFNNIFFGHGDDEPYQETSRNLGADLYLNALKTELRKNTRDALHNNIDFFNRIKNTETIHSFGFSFSKVDMIYIEEIAQRVDKTKVIWYLNSFDGNDKTIIKKLERLGFKVYIDSRW